MIMKKEYIKCCLWVWVFLMTISVQAQTAENTFEEDPLLKPNIWQQLSDDPYNDDLWMKYFDKDLFNLNSKEYELYTSCRNGLLQKNLAKQRKREEALQKFREEYVQQRYGEKQKLDYRELVQNIAKNFPMIEEYFDAQFNVYEIDYLFYDEKHPDGKYNKTKWVEEHETKLQKLKEDYLIK
ncbi:hypothetical protein AAG747_19685 [Rapidithrix thailandica]|uniref:Uncharacterized protein n=1 Tax=Rapidithrix thailandica TaxID=413964 RepID=A0AAW9SH32_9BACT